MSTRFLPALSLLPALAAADQSLTGTCPDIGTQAYTVNFTKGKAYTVEFITDGTASASLNGVYRSYGKWNFKAASTSAALNVVCAVAGSSHKINVLETTLGLAYIQTEPNAHVALSDASGDVATGDADASGIAALPVPKGSYHLRAFANDGGPVWNGGKPAESALAFSVGSSGGVGYLPLSARPVISKITVSGTSITLAGTGFGTDRGYYDVGKGAALPRTWADTTITGTITAGASGCARVFAVQGGWSECKHFGAGAAPTIQAGAFTVATTGANGAPVLSWVGDQIAINGVASGPHLTGPRGATGPKGADGAPGPQGPAGPANALTIGTVATGAASAATLTGTAPNQTLNLTLQRGPAGPAGPANALSIGTVTTGAAGSQAAASITGTAPAQTLNLTIPAGAPGQPGSGGGGGTPIPWISGIDRIAISKHFVIGSSNVIVSEWFAGGGGDNDLVIAQPYSPPYSGNVDAVVLYVGYCPGGAKINTGLLSINSNGTISSQYAAQGSESDIITDTYSTVAVQFDNPISVSSASWYFIVLSIDNHSCNIQWQFPNITNSPLGYIPTPPPYISAYQSFIPYPALAYLMPHGSQLLPLSAMNAVDVISGNAGLLFNTPFIALRYTP